jgi:uncharacterized protein YbjQ (UPF0145 family)
MTNYIIGAVVIAFIGMAGYCEVQKKQSQKEIKEAIEKTQQEERLACENMISEANQKSSDKTIKTIIKYEKVKSDVSNYDYNQRVELLQQLQAEDFNIAD